MADIGARRSGNDLLITVAGASGDNTGDQIRLKSWFSDSSGNHRIEQVVFADGTLWTHGNLANLALTTTNTGTEGNDSLAGTVHYSERLAGGDGNDTLTAVGNDDLLDGGAGDDVLQTSNANTTHRTTFNGGAGNDTITGTWNADTYLFDRGDGSDSITDVGPSSTTDKLVFGEGISDQDLWFSRSGNHLLVQVLGDDGQVQVNNWYGSANNRIEEMHLSDGQRLLYAQVDALVQAMAAFAPPAPGQTTLTPEQQSALAPVIAASWG